MPNNEFEGNDPPVPEVQTPGEGSSCAPTTPEPLATPPAVQSPPAIPDHTLLRRIGGGSYGEVWLARNIMGTYRAVKIVYRQHFVTERPFEREFHGIQAFEPVSRGHEGLIDLLHVGRNEAAGYFYYVMELADDDQTGPDLNPASYKPKTLLSELRRRGCLPPEECVRIGLSLSSALSHLHQHGLIHRDIKPSNIIFVHGAPKLADIGLVTEVSEAKSFVGTEGYIPPEGAGTPPADLYSLGKVLYELSTGKDRTAFPEPRTLNVDEESDPVTRELNEVTLRACQPDARTRYQTAEQMHQELLLLQSGKSVRHLRKVERRLAQITRVGVACLLVAALAVAAYFYEASHQRQYKQLANEKTKLADEKTRLANENQERLVRVSVANGLLALAAKEYAGALPWFVEALRLDQGNPKRAAIHRLRIGNTLAQAPRLAQLWFHDRPVTHGEFSPNARCVLTLCEDGVARVWEVKTGQLLASLAHGKVNDAQFSPDSQQVATASNDRTARLWDLAAGNEAIPPMSHTSAVLMIQFSLDGSRVATADAAFAVRVWETQTGRALTPPMFHKGRIAKMAFSRNGRYLAATGKNDFPRIWDVASGELSKVLPRSHQYTYDISFSADGRLVLLAGWGIVEIYDFTNGQLLTVFLKHVQGVFSAAFCPRGGSVLTASEDRTVRIWDGETGQELSPPLKHPQIVNNAAFDPTGRQIITACDNGVAQIWDAQSSERIGPPLHHGNKVNQACFSPDGRYALTVSQDSLARLWDLARPSRPDHVLAHKSFVEHITLSPDGRRVATTSDDHTARIWNVSDGQPITPPLQHDYNVLDADFSPDGSKLVTACMDGTARIWDAHTGQALTPWLEHPSPVFRCVFNRTGDQVITICAGTVPIDRTAKWYLDEQKGYVAGGILTFRNFHSWTLSLVSPLQIRVWATTGQAVTPLRPLEGSTGLAEFSPDRRKVVTGAPDQTARMWDVLTGQQLPFATPATSHVDQAIYSPDGRRLATLRGSQLKVWEIETGKLVLSLRHGTTIKEASFSPDGRRIVTASGDKTARVWEVATGQPITPPLMHEHSAMGARFGPDGCAVATCSSDMNAYLWDSATGEALGPSMSHRGYVIHVLFAPNGRHIITSLYQSIDPNATESTAHIWTLTPASLPLADMQSLAGLLSAYRLDELARLVPVEPAAYRAAWPRLQAVASASALLSSNQLAAWHFQRAAKAREAGQFALGFLHLEQVLAYDPGNGVVRSMLSTQSLFRLLQGDALSRFPPRGSGLSSKLIDLTDFYNGSPMDGWLPASNSGTTREKNLPLPSSILKLDGVSFDVRGLVQLASYYLAEERTGFPREVKGIPVQQSFERMHFLHGAVNLQPQGSILATYVIYYANEYKIELPVVYGEDVRDWVSSKSTPEQVKQGTLVWTGSNAAAKKTGRVLQLYRSTWQNPYPQIPVRSIHIISRLSNSALFVIAITVE